MKAAPIPKIFFAFAILVFAVFPYYAFAFGGTLNNYISSVKIGSDIIDSSASNASTKFSALDGCVFGGGSEVKFNLKKALPFKEVKFHFNCIDSSYFALYGDVPEKDVLVGSRYAFPGTYSQPAFNMSLVGYEGQACKIWIVDAKNSKNFANTRPFYICSNSGPEVEVVRYFSGTAGTQIDADVRNVKSGQDINAELIVTPLENKNGVFSLGKKKFTQNGKAEVFIPNVFLKSKYLIEAKVSGASQTTPTPAPSKPVAKEDVKFGSIKCSVNGTTISVQGSIEKPGSNAPLKAWILGYLCSQPQNEKFYKYLGTKDKISSSASLSGVASNLATDAKYCFEMRAQDKTGKIVKGSDQGKTDDCLTSKTAPKGDKISFEKKTVNGKYLHIITVDLANGYSEIGLAMPRNKLFADITGTDRAYSSQQSLIKAVGAKAAVGGPYYYQMPGWRRFLINATYAQNGKLMRLFNAGTQLCVTNSNQVLFGRFWVVMRVKTNNQQFDISNINAPSAANSIIAYTKEGFPNNNGGGWGSKTPNTPSKVIAISGSTIMGIYDGPITPPSSFDYLIVFYGTAREKAKNLKVGQTITLSYAPVSGNDVNLTQWQDCKTIIGGMHTIFQNGQFISQVGNHDKSMVDSWVITTKIPRTVVGTDGKSKIFFITFKQPLVTSEVTGILTKLGIKNAFTEDGDCSAFTYYDGYLDFANGSQCRFTVPAILYAK